MRERERERERERVGKRERERERKRERWRVPRFSSDSGPSVVENRVRPMAGHGTRTVHASIADDRPAMGTLLVLREQRGRDT